VVYTYIRKYSSSRGEYQPMSVGEKYEKGEEKRGRNVREKGRKKKEKEKVIKEARKRETGK
jgi:hypothetical protein